ncbi:unnamed protein product [Vitrella brassicaformis CCMP3155]|uniref:Uncharacterized protein n=1 Tax=Vitrella brassicaformis (strain CCMP3155) TaxID=1169540 RepID=A0A0G4F8F0_VITBC|nr:unnamed protein product [Vitrella brassicaformis CCMP3155]|eukprot:CEM09003.1 unnamed protein product [Vitrella brassicaformis CCMP3155]
MPGFGLLWGYRRQMAFPASASDAKPPDKSPDIDCKDIPVGELLWWKRGPKPTWQLGVRIDLDHEIKYKYLTSEPTITTLRSDASRTKAYICIRSLAEGQYAICIRSNIKLYEKGDEMKSAYKDRYTGSDKGRKTLWLLHEILRQRNAISGLDQLPKEKTAAGLERLRTFEREGKLITDFINGTVQPPPGYLDHAPNARSSKNKKQPEIKQEHGHGSHEDMQGQKQDGRDGNGGEEDLDQEEDNRPLRERGPRSKRRLSSRSARDERGGGGNEGRVAKHRKAAASGDQSMNDGELMPPPPVPPAAMAAAGGMRGRHEKEKDKIMEEGGEDGCVPLDGGGGMVAAAAAAAAGGGGSEGYGHGHGQESFGGYNGERIDGHDDQQQTYDEQWMGCIHKLARNRTELTELLTELRVPSVLQLNPPAIMPSPPYQSLADSVRDVTIRGYKASLTNTPPLSSPPTDDVSHTETYGTDTSGDTYGQRASRFVAGLSEQYAHLLLGSIAIRLNWRTDNGTMGYKVGLGIGVQGSELYDNNSTMMRVRVRVVHDLAEGHFDTLRAPVPLVKVSSARPTADEVRNALPMQQLFNLEELESRVQALEQLDEVRKQITSLYDRLPILFAPHQQPQGDGDVMLKPWVWDRLFYIDALLNKAYKIRFCEEDDPEDTHRGNPAPSTDHTQGGAPPAAASAAPAPAAAAAAAAAVAGAGGRL